MLEVRMTDIAVRRVQIVATLTALFFLMGIPNGSAQSRPAFDDYFPSPSASQLVDNPYGKLYVTGAANGFEDMADPECRKTKGLDKASFTTLSRRLLVLVDEASSAAYDTGLDPRSAEVAYVAIVGTERQKRIIELSARQWPPETSPFAIARLRRSAIDTLSYSADKINSALRFMHHPGAGKFSHHVFDMPQIYQLSMAVTGAYDDALKALPEQTRDDLKQHWIAASSARTKATDFAKANRLGPQEVRRLIENDLVQNCIPMPPN